MRAGVFILLVNIQLLTLVSAGSDEDCNEPLILPGIVNLTSISTRNYSSSYGPYQAILHNTHAWCANESNADQFLIADLGLVKMIKSIEIQGNPNDDELLKTFSISYGVLDGQWITYTETGAKRVFAGNSKQVLKHIVAARHVRINPETWYGHVCARLQLYGCNADPLVPLGVASREIPNSAMTASSYYGGLYPHGGRLLLTISGFNTCWAAGSSDINQWLQIDVGRLTFVTAVATQGRHISAQWVLTYWLSYSNDTTTFIEYNDQNLVKKTFQGNTDTSTVVRHLLSPVVFARFVRFNPITWHYHASMRVEVYSYGRASPSDLGIAFGSPIEVPDSQITASSAYDANHASYYGRLNSIQGAYSWCPSSLNGNHWLMFDLGHVMLLTGVVTSSRGNGLARWLTTYKVSHSPDKINWIFYKDKEQDPAPKVFQGNAAIETYVTNHFNRDIKARYIKIYPLTWVPSPNILCFRASVIGRREGPLGSPVFTIPQDHSYITVYKNQDVTLKCEAVGDTPITITWTHNGQVLQSKTTDTHLTLTSVTKAQEGFYNCSASNTLRTNSKMFYLHVKETFEVCSKYKSLSDDSRLSTSSSSYKNDDSKLDETDWYLFKDNNNYLRIPTTCVPENRCGATAPGYMQGALPTVNEGIVKRKVYFHSNRNCCHYSVDIYVRNCYMFYVYNLKKLDESWKGRYCGESYKIEKPITMFYSQGEPGLPLMPSIVTRRTDGVTDGITCMTYCNIDDKCDSYSFNPHAKACLLHNTTLNKSVAPIHRKDYQYFDKVTMN